MKKVLFVVMVMVAVGLFAISAFAQNPCVGKDCKQGWNQSDLRQPAPGQVTLRVGTYNNTRPGSQFWLGVDAVEIRPNLRSNGAQLWFHEDGRWDGQGGKFSLLFPTREALERYCVSPYPSPVELRARAAAEPLCPSSVGKGQKWLVF